MNSHGVEISIAGCVEEMVRDPNPMSFFFFFFLFFFYHAFIVFRYKKLRAVLAMERTKPINQKHTTKETILPIHRASLKVLRPKPWAYRPLWKHNIGKM